MAIDPSPDVVDAGINGPPPPKPDTTDIQAGKIDKMSVLYLHIIGTDYECKDCILFIKDGQCVIHRPNDDIKATDSCGLFVYGRAMENGRPLGIITPQQSGLVHSKNGFSCKRCKFFNPGHNVCSQVDENTPGDDPGQIHPDACCNVWQSAA